MTITIQKEANTYSGKLSLPKKKEISVYLEQLIQ